ncbi:flavin reductase family protein [Neptunomonas phycophila]|uniref:Flavin reductase family protein n=1 Tax=Neptunomonas phycophila TaxID=1572645 RepID=A0AAW7XHW4_9GAMM|nr:flavin reductase family protein [Neptunomonas phycophila]MDO6453898.1 flavin reductase family protein [Neptunomonas phycophila]
MLLDFSTLSKSAVYHTLTQVVIPRPVAWVLSEHENGELNLAPFSYFAPVCSEPPLIMISVGYKPDGTPKDTCVNIQEHGHFVVHIASSDLAGVMTQTSAVLPAGESEVSKSGLETTDFEGFSLPRVLGPSVAMACMCYKIDTIGPGNQNLIFGQVERVWVDDQVVEVSDSGRINIGAKAIDPLGRMGGGEYSTLGEVIDIPRPK